MNRSGTILLGVALLLGGAPLPVLHAQKASVPTPAEVFGFEPGADYRLADYTQMLEYFRRLDEASERVRVEEIGRSVLGRPMILAYISSEENIRRLDQWRQTSERLARAREIDDAAARRLAREGKAVVWIDGGLHATEVAGAQHSPVLAHRVATEDSDEMRLIRDNVVLLLMPVMNPDGLDIVVGWYKRNLGTPFEVADLPWLYHHYVGHDNNRDWYMLLQPESRAVARKLYHEWFPQIVYNQHQTAPFPARIFVPPFADPLNPNIPALVTRGVNLVGDAMTRRLTAEGKSGAVSRVGFDMWWNGGMRTTPYFHNMIGILTETALHRYATPRFYPPDSLPDDFGRRSTLSAAQPSISYPDPWQGGWWRLRDAVDYMVTGSMAVLDIAAELKEDWLYNFYRMGRHAIELGRAGKPFAYVIPAEQWDPGEAVELVNVLRRGGVEVQRASQTFEAGGKRFAAGAYVVPAAQAFRPHVVDLMEKQAYPDMRLYPGGPPRPPYDIAGYTLPIQMGVTVERVEAPFEARLEAVDVASPPPGRVAGDAAFGYLLSHKPNGSARAVNRLLKSGERVSWAAAGFEAAEQRWEDGTIVVRSSGRRTAERVETIAREIGLDFAGIARKPDVTLHDLRMPRVALYKSWVSNMDEGWTRWLLEQYEFAVDTLHDRDIRRGDLSRYDAIVLPDQSPGRILNGHAPGTMLPEYTGGVGVEGAAALKRFVEGGGTVVALDAASDFAIEQFGLPVENSVSGASQQSFYIPGSLIRLTVEPKEPIAYGMPKEAAAFFAESRAFDIVEPASSGDRKAAGLPVRVAARYAENDLLLSGWALGEQRHLGGKPAVVQVGVGSGEVVLIGFRAQFRAQPRGTYKFLFNALHGSTVQERMRGTGVADGR